MTEKNLKLRAADLLEEAIECPFTTDKEEWDKWCKGWRIRAEHVIRGLRE